MRSIPFTALVLAVFAALLGLRFALAPLGQRVADALAPKAAAEGVMALPPKPEGLSPRAAGEGGSGGEAMLTPAACEAMPADVRDTCRQALARQSAERDPKGALDVCATIVDPELAYECHADVAEASAVVDRSVGEAICAAIPSVKWRGQCHFGMGLALAETDSAYAISRCDHAEAFLRFCRHDVVGEIALVDEDAAVAICAKEEGDTLTRSTCWHGIGKYLARRDLTEATAACGRSTPDWRANCVHGAGWGAAERDVEAALATCLEQGPFADNCRHGVANQLKRYDAARAVALCESIATSVVRTRCLEFVKR